MKFALKSLNSLVLAGLLAAGAGASAMAEGPTTTAPASPAAAAGQQAGPHGSHRMMGRHDPAAMQAWMAKRQAEMKAKLKITAAQEGAWTSFTAAMQPPARMMGERPMAGQRAELDKLTAPERIDKMRAMRTQRMTEMNAEMDKRGEATKTFYAALSPEQQKIFDAEHRKMGRHGGAGHYQGDMQPKG